MYNAMNAVDNSTATNMAISHSGLVWFKKNCLFPPFDNISYRLFIIINILLSCLFRFIVKFLFLLKLIIVKLSLSSKSITVAVIC